MDISERLKEANSRLKADRVRVRVCQMGHKLYLQATLPPKPGAAKNHPHQQWLSLGIQATPEGLKLAVARARLVSAQLDCREFSWEPYLGETPKPTILAGDWIEKFEQSYFSVRARSPKTETTWKDDYLRPFSKLRSDQPLSVEALEELIKTTPPDTRTRRRYVIAATALAKYAGLTANFKILLGGYSPRKAVPRNLPSDELIAQTRETIKAPDWQWAFGILAAYGLRPHELFHLNLDDFPVLYVQQGKTGFRHVRPIYPEWATSWDLGNAKPPACSGRTNSDLGNRVSHAFRRHGISFHAYDLRHRWAIRSMEWGLDLSLAAAEMGHSVQVHSSLYHHWISQSVHDKNFERLANRPDRPKPPGYSQ